MNGCKHTARGAMALIASALVVVAACSSNAEDTASEQSGERGASGSNGSRSAGGSRHGSNGSGGSEDSGSPGEASLGTACSTTANCKDGLTCVTTIGEQTLPGGLCTTVCGSDPENPHAECEGLDSASVCLALGPPDVEEPWCVQACTPGVASSCHGREDAACVELVDSELQDSISSACVPLCNADAFCPSGTVCDGETNLCSPSPDPGTLPLGAECDPDAEVDECASGACVRIDDEGEGFCSSLCRLGTVPQCGWDGPGSEEFSGFCGIVTGDNVGDADFGFCTETCDTTDDCLHPGFVCNPQEGLDEFGKSGICFTEL